MLKSALEETIRDTMAAIVRIRCNWMDRSEVVAILQDRLCIQCYDHETVEADFAPSLLISIQDGDLELDDLPSTDVYAEKQLLERLQELQEEVSEYGG